MERDLIYQNLEAIWSALGQLGDEQEKEISSYLFFVLRFLKRYWYDLDVQSFSVQCPKEEDEIEVFLEGINEF